MSWGSSSDYFRDLETVTQGLSQVFGAGLSLETCITSLAQHYQKCVSKGPSDAATPPLRSKPVSPQSLLDPLSPAANLEATENPESASEEEIKQKTEERIRQSLIDVCSEPAARLCPSEFAVVQQSVQLIGSGEDALSVQVLEDAHKVDPKGLSSCTCHFNQAFQLPCRHILAVLNSERETLQPEVQQAVWQKGGHARQAGQDSADGLMEVLTSSWNESLDKSLVVSFLTAEISQLLTHCSKEEFACRYRTLRALADSWIRPYVEVKL
ncbi:PREDICTED: zinc finger SWIM domain-containing protein 1-like [Chaetura pelagica]|uniref:zinc finger SWIM domain-containing protein 1-like n=1 Tax=Chaetura pelagica TaxID=8897 RepID=UPI000523BF7A|nr:PREDICTED: zinc finger SWIM domain-containing protein 1-like [Chaetura pelagica]